MTLPQNIPQEVPSLALALYAINLRERLEGLGSSFRL
jgi:hypothetical protein